MKTAKIYSMLLGALILSPFTSFSQDYNFTGSLAGTDPGIIVITNDATPGSASARLMIRGIGSYAEGLNANTLKFYIDGFEVKSEMVNYLNPEEIQSVKILKNAKDLAAMGMNGANGVVWIETKKGMESKPVITFTTRGGVQTPINVAKPLRSYDYATLYNQAYSNDNGRDWDPYYDIDVMGDYKNGTGIDVNWYDQVFRNLGSVADATLSVRGGSDKLRYNVVLDYANQQGMLNVANTDKTHNVSFAKYGLHTNLEMKLNKVLTVGVDISGRLEDRARPNYSVYQLVNDVMNYPSNIYPIYDKEATDPISNFSGTSVHPNNPMGSLTGLGWTTSRTKVMLANFTFREDLDMLAKGLYLQQAFSFYSRTIGNTAKTRTYARYMNGVAQTSDQSSYIRSVGYWSSGKERWMQGNIKAGYDGRFDQHEINAALTAHISDFNGSGSQFYNWKYRYINYTASLDYAFDNRYEAGVALSYFGSDAYAKGKRYVLYPTASFAWNASNEEFLKNSSTVNNLKIKASAGMTGSSEANANIAGFETDGRYLYQQYYAWDAGLVTGLGPGFGGGNGSIKPLFNANPNVTAERSMKADLGFDLTVLGKLSISATAFYDYRDRILTRDNSIMDYTGNNIYFDNIGKMINRGAEANIVFSDKKGDFAYSVFANALFAQNKVLNMGEVPTKHPYNSATGLPYGTRMGLECLGFYDISDFDLDGDLNMGLPVPQFGAVQPGDLKYKDQDGDGIIDDTDIIAIGAPAYPLASFNLGFEFNYKAFDFSMILAGTAGSTVNLMDYQTFRPFVNYGNAFAWAKKAWAFYPEAGIDTRKNAAFPRLTTQQNDHNYRSSSFWIKKNNYLRVQNIELGYDLASLECVRRCNISKCRFYISGHNVFTLSKLLMDYKMDPETVNYGYPNASTYNLGFQISF